MRGGHRRGEGREMLIDVVSVQSDLRDPDGDQLLETAGQHGGQLHTPPGWPARKVSATTVTVDGDSASANATASNCPSRLLHDPAEESARMLPASSVKTPRKVGRAAAGDQSSCTRT